MIKFMEQGDHVTFEIIVQPRAGRNQVAGQSEGALKIKIAAPPVRGRANAECERFLAGLLGVRRADIEIVSGTTARRKLIRVRRLSGAALAEKMNSVLAPRPGKTPRRV